MISYYPASNGMHLSMKFTEFHGFHVKSSKHYHFLSLCNLCNLENSILIYIGVRPKKRKRETEFIQSQRPQTES